MRRRDLPKTLGLLALTPASTAMARTSTSAHDTVTLLLTGDVMTGRGIDQVLPHPGDPRTYERYSRPARDYVELAERVNGAIPRPVDYDYLWGDALQVLEAAAPDVRIINLETAVTREGAPWPRKVIHYRMHPANIPCLTAAAIDCCVLANNHVLDWGHDGLEETVDSLTHAGLACVGAGADLAAAQAPAVLALPGHGRVLVFAACLGSSGVPSSWAAGTKRAGVHRLSRLTEDTVEAFAGLVQAHRQAGDTVVVSLHWGGNWGYDIPADHTRFAHGLIEAAQVDVVHGHSSHHPMGMELYRGKTILYGCGDLINDYEGISSHRQFRGELGLLYLLTLRRDTGAWVSLEMVPVERRQFRLHHAMQADSEWLRQVLDRECRSLGTRVISEADDRLALRPA